MSPRLPPPALWSALRELLLRTAGSMPQLARDVLWELFTRLPDWG